MRTPAPQRAARPTSPLLAANRTRETAQQIDPLSGITARIFVFVVGVISIGTAICLAVSNGPQVQQLPLQLLAIATLAAAYVFFVVSAEPYRKRVTRRRYSVVFAIVLLAAVFDGLSQLGADTLIRDDWGPVCIALVLMLAGPYRPPLEIVVYTVIALVVIGVLTVIQESTLVMRMTFIALTIAGTPTLALGIGAAIYSGYLIAGLRADRARAAEARERRDASDRRGAIERFLGDDMKSLRSDVLPFFRDVKARDALTPADIDRAAELQSQLRASIVSNLSSEPLQDLVGTLDDPQQLARHLTEPQRSALRAYLVFLADQPTIRRRDITLTFIANETGRQGCITCPVDSDRTLASRTTPFVGLLQLAFTGVVDALAAHRVNLTFGF